MAVLDDCRARRGLREALALDHGKCHFLVYGVGYQLSAEAKKGEAQVPVPLRGAEQGHTKGQNILCGSSPDKPIDSTTRGM